MKWQNPNRFWKWWWICLLWHPNFWILDLIFGHIDEPNTFQHWSMLVEKTSLKVRRKILENPISFWFYEYKPVWSSSNLNSCRSFSMFIRKFSSKQGPVGFPKFFFGFGMFVQKVKLSKQNKKWNEMNAPLITTIKNLKVHRFAIFVKKN